MRRVSGAIGLAAAVLLAGVLFAAVTKASRVGAELDAAKRFLSRARAFEPGANGPLRCSGPGGGQAQASQAMVGERRFVALVQLAAPASPNGALELLVGSNRCTTDPGTIDDLEGLRGWTKHLNTLFYLRPSRWQAVFDPVSLPMCMSTWMTSYAISAKGHLAVAGSRLEGQLEIRIADFGTDETLCEGTLPVLAELQAGRGDDARVGQALSTFLSVVVDGLSVTND